MRCTSLRSPTLSPSQRARQRGRGCVIGASRAAHSTSAVSPMLALRAGGVSVRALAAVPTPHRVALHLARPSPRTMLAAIRKAVGLGTEQACAGCDPAILAKASRVGGGGRRWRRPASCSCCRPPHPLPPSTVCAVPDHRHAGHRDGECHAAACACSDSCLSCSAAASSLVPLSPPTAASLAPRVPQAGRASGRPRGSHGRGVVARER